MTQISPRTSSALAVSILIGIALTGCQSVPVEASFSPVNTTTDHFEFGEFTSSAWVSETFSGTHTRQFRDQALHFGVDQTAPEGGVDVGL